MYYYKLLQEVKWRLFNESASMTFVTVATLKSRINSLPTVDYRPPAFKF
ncbi:hypothetical protein T09_899 [Trichinella sp. T9]|nr:hypothetical protein T09_899 [Trichinella sp. T9]